MKPLKHRPNFEEVSKELLLMRDPEKAAVLKRFFKCGRGEYGEGDKFLGITVPRQRKVAKENRSMSEGEVRRLLMSGYHEFRLTGLLIVTYAFRETDEDGKSRWYEFYLRNVGRIDNWDLVDVTAPIVVGEFMADHPEELARLESLAASKNLWERRIAVLATFALLRRNEFGPTLDVARMLLRDEHDLIHKAVGWMLREVGKRDRGVEEVFLREHATVMPRTMLRYAIEKFPPDLKKAYMEIKRKI